MDRGHILLGVFGLELAATGVLLIVLARVSGPMAAARRRIQPHLGAVEAPVRRPADALSSLLIGLGGLGVSSAERAGLEWQMRRSGRDASGALLRHGWTRLLVCGGAAGVAAVAGKFLATAAPDFTVLLQLSPIAVAALAWGALGLRASTAAAARALDISAGLTDALELLLICIGSGLALEQGLARVAAEVRPRQPELAAELQLTISDLQVMADPQSAFRSLARRVPSKSIDAIVGILCQSLEYGSPLAAALREVVDHTRKSELLALEERASKFPSLVTLPTLIFIFPALLILLIGPAALNLLGSLDKV